MITEYIYHPHRWHREERSPAVFALGYFDGVHLGHQEVIRTAKQKAEERNVECVVMTFHPHPKAVLSADVNEEDMRYITPLPEKEKTIEALGCDRLLIVSFDATFSKLIPQAFVDHYLIDLGAVHVVAGFDYTYGQLGKGTMETLPFHARGCFEQTTVSPYVLESEKVSSTKIRELIQAGDMQEVNVWLGREFSIVGKVVTGERRGRTIGFPTANVQCEEPFMLPATGVYTVSFIVEGETIHGVANVGYKPTFHTISEDDPTVEVHLLDFEGDLYGKKATVVWHERLRGEVKFSSIDELKEQIGKDRAAARSYFSS
ncbi:bifunctional riboflavin kinase/FAD synthetase [Salsuginibacillus kocurii]|uniref:bifunctional riboflavin kinase/FAD synthetase n=1 Tax=Salsuginibacillus kocurii TaxID=427078 RepID=UPI0003608EBF|nr:bifunctional riboflavin kinase/FAD synthetase [Salsuginibacillus kocurii]